ncbi:adenylate/guanylate cyclase domain-containing protein [Rhizobium leguminosarum]|uniref:Adenylate cyclase n=1 Tax=Rhizobium leguminosarum TaxID=384 RepID=A0A2K9Z2X6_RHILE|nr:adenylate/guanylate cyclase domain-containing protein [Rhizobium leguminosarum]AUW42594.1 Adenylate cyclase [Rhizobium leguminosarum]
MKNNRVAWLMQSGIEGMTEADLLSGFCTRCAVSRVPVERASAVIEALHPMYERRALRWDANNALERMSEFGMGTGGSLAMNWERTAFFHLRTTGDIEVRRRFSRGDAADFYLLDSMKADGFTDFVALAHRFGGNGTIGEIDCFFSQVATRAPGGFSEADLNALKALVPCLALATKCVAMSGVARTIAKVYLGEDAAQHVLHGEMRRDRADRIAAALWFSDLANFTRISDLSDPDEIIPMINDYAEAVISSVKTAGGEVLKLMGYGTLAIFGGATAQKACEAALRGRFVLERELVDLNARRRIEGRAVTEVYLGLHFGDVFYGNIGGRERLDFTVIGPAVNEVSRINSLCRSLDRKLLVSSQFASALNPDQGSILLSLGAHTLRGVSRPQELFTIPQCEHAMATA